MRRILSANRTVLALSVNAFLLLLILLAVSSRDGRRWPGSVAMGQYQTLSQQTAAGALTVMPGQLSANHWGCYVMDAQNQTLCVYQFDPGKPELRLEAARDIQNDRRLPMFNTSPSPAEIKGWVERADEGIRAAPTTNRSPEAVSP